MPFKSKSQQRFMFAKHPKMAERWAHHTKDIKSLPEHVDGADKTAAYLGFRVGLAVKLAAPLGPFNTDMAANVSGLDSVIAGASSNRHEHLGHYLLNPFVRGPMSEIAARLLRRASAGMAHSPTMSIAGNAISPLIPAVAGGAEKREQLRGEFAPIAEEHGDVGDDKAVVAHRKAKKEKPKAPAEHLGKAAAHEKIAINYGAAMMTMLRESPQVVTKLLGRFGRFAGQAGQASMGKANTIMGPASAETATVGAPSALQRIFGTTKATSGAGKAMEALSPFGKSQAGRVGSGAGLAASGATGGIGVRTALHGMTGKMDASPAGGPQPGPDQGATPAVAGPTGSGTSLSPSTPSPAAQGSSTATPEPASEAAPGKPSWLQRNGPLAAGLGLGAAAVGGGAAYAMKRRKRKQEEGVEKTSAERVLGLLTRAAARRKEAAAKILCTHLDKIASIMPLASQAPLRRLQQAVAVGKPLSVAIKAAYPQLSGEQRGILAVTLTRSAAKAANALIGPMGNAPPSPSSVMPTTGTQSFTGPPAQGMDFMRSN